MVPGIVRWGWQHAQRMCISHRLFVSEMLPTTGQHDTTRMGCGRGMRRPEADASPRLCGGSEYLRGVRDRCWGPDACGVWSASGRLNLDTHATRSWWRGRVYQAKSPHDREYGGEPRLDHSSESSPRARATNDSLKELQLRTSAASYPMTEHSRCRPFKVHVGAVVQAILRASRCCIVEVV